MIFLLVEGRIRIRSIQIITDLDSRDPKSGSGTLHRRVCPFIIREVSEMSGLSVLYINHASFVPENHVFSSFFGIGFPFLMNG
jgi:hypothetical protein